MLVLTKVQFCFSSWICTVQSEAVLWLRDLTEISQTLPGAGWSHLVWSWSRQRRLGSRWCCLCTGCPQGTKGRTAGRGSGRQMSHSQTTQTTRTSCLQQAQRDTRADTVIKELKGTEWEKNSLCFWVRTESLLPSYHHRAERGQLLHCNETKAAWLWQKSLKCGCNGKFATDISWFWLLPWPLCVQVRCWRILWRWLKAW